VIFEVFYVHLFLYILNYVTIHGMNNIKFEGKESPIILTSAGEELKHILNLHSIWYQACNGLFFTKFCV